jgi:2-methylaconitate cis-trans-isomerase PrpF
MRGGTSKALIFRAADLPESHAERDRIFLAAMGSPDATGRQLDGMGGGLSSLSKVCIVGPPTHPEADVDYTFGQVAVDAASVDYSGNCGNMSSAIGPFAVDEGLVKATGNEVIVRIHNTNTHKLIVARFAVRDGRAVVEGDFRLPGVSGSGAPIRLDFLDPGGAGTGRLLPTRNVLDMLEVMGLGNVAVSMVDAANPCVFVAAKTLGMSGIEMPDELERRSSVLKQLEVIRVAASLRMGIANSPAEAASKPSIPKVAVVASPQTSRSLSDETIDADTADIVVRMISIGQPHRAVPLTGAMCLAVATRLEGSLVHQLARRTAALGAPVRIAQPSGITVVDAAVNHERHGWVARHASVYRTARRLMDGFVYVPASAIE